MTGTLALSFVFLAQIRTTVPPSPLPPPRTQEKAMQEQQLAALQQRGDLHYLRRADGRNGDVAAPREIDAALDAYQAALGKDRGDADSRWKYLRATYFKAEYTGLPDAQKAALYERAIPIAEEAVGIQRDRAARRTGGRAGALEPPEISKALSGDAGAAETFFWSAVTWGQWSLVHGKLAAVRMGAAAKIRDEAQVVIGIAPDLEDAGGYRVLGRLHAESPKVIFFTGWIDRDQAIRDLRKAVAIAPGNLINRLFLAEALHDYGNDPAEVKRLLDDVSAATPHPEHIVEDLRAQATARRHLAEWEFP
jgi:tetratricopeptide (TPR) repeat protein